MWQARGWLMLLTACVWVPCVGVRADQDAVKMVPGTGKIIVAARLADGTKPVGAKCYAGGWPQWGPPPEWRGVTGLFSVAGADGDWLVSNVPPGDWVVEVWGADLAPWQRCDVSVKAGEEKLVSLTLVRGGSIAGRVVNAETGEPMSGASVGGGGCGMDGQGRPIVVRECRAPTDREGRYTVDHLAPGRGSVVAWAEGFVINGSQAVEVRDGETSVAPDIPLSRGGWIVGNLALPEGLTRDRGVHLSGTVTPYAEGQPLKGVVIPRVFVTSTGGFGFRLGPLPAGLYRVEGSLSPGKGSSLEDRWHGEAKGIRVEVGKETKGIVIPVSLVKPPVTHQ